MTDLLEQLVAACACEVLVTVNAHTTLYDSAAEYLSDDHFKTVAPEVRAEMIQRNTIVEVQAYPRTPVGFYWAAHWDITTALQIVLEKVLAAQTVGSETPTNQ